MPLELVLVDQEKLLPAGVRRLLEQAAAAAHADDLLVVATVLRAAPSRVAVSRREHDVLRLLALGHTNREIAEALGISVRTVEVYRRNLQRKLGATTRADLVARAHAGGNQLSAETSASKSTSSSSGIE